MLFDCVETPPYMAPPSINVCVVKNFMCVCFDIDTHECMLKCFDLELLCMSCVSICIHFEVLVDTLIPP